jgi:hypothetical protein
MIAEIHPQASRADRIARSLARIAHGRELVRMWRHRHPVMAGAGDSPTVRSRVRAALHEGALGPIEKAVSWPTGYGSGRSCHACGEVIRRRDLEHEVVAADLPVSVHAACLRIWREESPAAAENGQPGIGTVLDLIMAAPTCRGCIVARLHGSTEAADTALAMIDRAIAIKRPSRARCALCGSARDIMSLTGRPM